MMEGDAMARRLDVEALDTGKSRRHYPEEWLDGTVWEIRISEDAVWAKNTDSFLNSLRGYSRPKGFKIRGKKVTDDTVWIQAIKIPDQERSI